jgi:4-hydroxy-4-methyl-2-oxoglutarate aldolase
VSDAVTTLAELGVATVYEAGGRTGLIDAPLISVVPGARVAGPARTVKCAQGDNLMVHAAMDRLRHGEVLVLTMEEPAPVALLGEMLAIQAVRRGATGVLVDAAVRDMGELRELGLPVWTRFVRVRGAAKERVGAVDVPVTVAGVEINPGDIVVLDEDGGVVVPRERVEEVAAEAQERAEKERALKPRLEAGELTLDIHALRAKLDPLD